MEKLMAAEFGAIGSAFAVGAAIGPLSEMFDEQLLVYVLAGVAGGATFSFIRWTGCAALVKQVLVGGLLGGGLSTVAALMSESVLGFQVGPGDVTSKTIASLSYAIGLAQERVAEHFLLKKKEAADEDA